MLSLSESPVPLCRLVLLIVGAVTPCGMRTLYVLTLIFLLSSTGCASVPGSPPSQLRWGTYRTHAANNGVSLYGDVGDEVRLLNPAGAVVSSAVLHAPTRDSVRRTTSFPCHRQTSLPLTWRNVAGRMGTACKRSSPARGRTSSRLAAAAVRRNSRRADQGEHVDANRGGGGVGDGQVIAGGRVCDCARMVAPTPATHSRPVRDGMPALRQRSLQPRHGSPYSRWLVPGRDSHQRNGSCSGP